MARRLGLVIVAGVFATSVAFPALAPAQTSATVPVTGGSWYWQEQVGSANPPAGTPLPTLAPPAAVPTPAGTAGDFPGSAGGGQRDQASSRQRETCAIPDGWAAARR